MQSLAFNGHTAPWIQSFLRAAAILLFGGCFSTVAQNPAAQLFQKPCIDPQVLTDLTSHYPVPVSVSPDGKSILLRTANPPLNPFGLAVIDRASGKIAHSRTWPQPLLRLQWSPDSSEILFFAMRGLEKGRDLFIWNLSRDDVRHIATPETTAEPQVRWAPNGQLIAFSNFQESFVVVHTSGDSPPFIFFKNVSEFDWLSDSKSIAFVEHERPNQLQFIDVSTGEAKFHNLPNDISILEIAASPFGDSVLLVESSASKKWILEMLEVHTGRFSTVIRSPSRLASPMWFPDGRGFCFQRFRKNAEEIVADLQGRRQFQRLPTPGGVNDIRGVLPDGHAVVVAHSGDTPVAILSLSATGEIARVFASHSKTLPSVKAATAVTRSPSGDRVQLLVWHGVRGQAAPVAVIRVRGGLNTPQLPVWEEHIQILVKHGIDVLAVNQSGEGTSQRERREALVAAIQYANRKLGVPLERILLLGHSSGADLVAATCATIPGLCTKIVLVAFGRIDDVPPAQPKDSPDSRIIVFYPAYDYTPRYTVLQNLRKAFGPEIFNALHTSFFQFPDDHNLMYPSSWAAVYSAILAEFHQGGCVERAP